MRTLGTLASFLLALGPLAAQTASYTPFGNPCAPGLVPLTAVNLPRLGQVFQLQMLSGSNGVTYEGGTASALLIGRSRSSWLGLPLPMSHPTLFALFGVGACGDLSVSAEIVLPLPHLRPRALQTLSFPIPNQPALLGMPVFFQAADYRFNLRGMLGITFGDAGEARIGR